MYPPSKTRKPVLNLQSYWIGLWKHAE